VHISSLQREGEGQTQGVGGCGTFFPSPYINISSKIAGSGPDGTLFLAKSRSFTAHSGPSGLTGMRLR